MKKRITAALCAAIVASAFVLTGCGGAKDETDTADTSGNNEVQTQQEEAEANEPERVTPTLMYFISAEDEDFDGENELMKELEEEYGDDVIFNVINIDENPEAAENFSAKGQTPMVIMLNTLNDISAINPMCSDRETLEGIIKTALEQ